MIQVLDEQPGIISLEYHKDRGFVVFNWTSFNIMIEDIRRIFPKALELTRQGKAYYYIAETSKVKNVLQKEIIDWWGNVWVPKLVQAGLKGIVTVVPSSALATASTNTWQAEVVNGITMKNVKSFVEAMMVVKQLQAG